VFNAVSTNSRATRFAMLYFTPIWNLLSISSQPLM
jgi:hypothetical protein